MPQIAEKQAITLLLGEFADGDKKALDQLMPLVYIELKKLARGALRREHGAHTLQPTIRDDCSCSRWTRWNAKTPAKPDWLRRHISRHQVCRSRMLLGPRPNGITVRNRRVPKIGRKHRRATTAGSHEQTVISIHTFFRNAVLRPGAKGNSAPYHCIRRSSR